MTAKEYLIQYQRCKVRIMQAKESLKELDEGIDSLAIDYSGMPHGSGVTSKVEQYVVRLEHKREPILQRIAELYGLMMEIADAVSNVESELHSELLYYRYIVGLPWDQVAEALGYEEGYVRGTLHGKALQLLKYDT